MIHCDQLSKTYILRDRPSFFRRGNIRRIEALRGVSLTVPTGGLVGLLGPNGAGKTTLLKILATLLVPTSGQATIAGVNVLAHPRQARKLIGLVLAGERTMYWKLTGRENLHLFAGLYDVPGRVAKKRAAQLLEQVGLREFADTPVEKYSSGMHKRLALAKAFIHEPLVLILDEPTTGLDVGGKREVWQSLKRMREETKVTILLATHDMEEAEALSQHLLIIDQGKIVVQGKPGEIKAQAGVSTLSDAFLFHTGRAWDGDEDS